ncbi:unnamed protein product [Rotaria sp. Silwood2]|nr:unnamed protein product [Rotaria sp. Silwood2]
MMGNHARAWSMDQQLSDEYFDIPDNDTYHVLDEIATDMPHVESEKAMEIWYPNIFNYLESPTCLRSMESYLPPWILPNQTFKYIEKEEEEIVP